MMMKVMVVVVVDGWVIMYGHTGHLVVAVMMTVVVVVVVDGLDHSVRSYGSSGGGGDDEGDGGGRC